MAEQSAPGRRTLRRTKRRRRLILAGLAGILFLAALVAAKPAYHWVKTRRADALSAEAEHFVQQGKLGEAAVDYRAALSLDPFGYRPLRGAAALATRLHHSEALPLWEQVARTPQATVNDREEYAGALLQAGMFSKAEKTIDGLLRQNPSSRALLLASAYSADVGNQARALEYARLATKQSPNDEAAQARLAEILAASPKTEERAEARAILWKLIAHGGTTQREALEALVRAPELTADGQRKLLGVVQSISPFTVGDALLAADLELRMHPENTAAIYDEIISKWKANEAARTRAAQWLNLHGQADRVLDLTPVEASNKQLLLARLDALATKKRWSEIDETLARPDLGFDPTVIEAFRARAAQEQHATLDAEFHWGKAIDAANNDPEKLRFVAEFAERSGATEAALRAFDQLGRWPEHLLVAVAGQQRLAAKARDMTAARDLAEKALALQGNDPDAQNRALYYNLLLEKDVADDAAKAKELATKFPNRLEYRVTAALGCLRQHDAADALAQFNGPPIDWQKTQPAWRAVYAATLMANEQTAQARKIIKTIPIDRLAAEEVSLIK
jgi:tetratricopeptide (TPR) repeat protein